MRIKKVDKEWLEGICGDYTEDIISLMKSYIKQSKAECNKKNNKGFMIESNNIDEHKMISIIANTLLQNTKQEQLNTDRIHDFDTMENQFFFKYGERKAIYRIEVTID